MKDFGSGSLLPGTPCRLTPTRHQSRSLSSPPISLARSTSSPSAGSEVQGRKERMLKEKSKSWKRSNRANSISPNLVAAMGRNAGGPMTSKMINADATLVAPIVAQPRTLPILHLLFHRPTCRRKRKERKGRKRRMKRVQEVGLKVTRWMSCWEKPTRC